MTNEVTIIPESGAATYRLSTDAAGLSKAIVLQTAVTIQGRKYVKVEGWQAIAVAHGCAASAERVQRVEGGVTAIGQVRRMDTGVVIAEAEGFVGEDEPVWFGGQLGNKTLPKRPDYAIRAMAQTRAISRACRSAFAHVVVMIDKNLSTTPAEEMPYSQTDDDADIEALNSNPNAPRDADGRLLGAYQADKVQKAKEWADAAITRLNLTGKPQEAKEWRAESSTIPAGKKKAPLGWLKDNSPGQYLRVRQAYQNVTGEDL